MIKQHNHRYERGCQPQRKRFPRNVPRCPLENVRICIIASGANGRRVAGVRSVKFGGLITVWSRTVRTLSTGCTSRCRAGSLSPSSGSRTGYPGIAQHWLHEPVSCGYPIPKFWLSYRVPWHSPALVARAGVVLVTYPQVLALVPGTLA
jgi:hypothetical protein